MSDTPRIVLSADDVEYLIDECSHIDRGSIVSGLSAHRHLTERHEQVNRARWRAELARVDFAAFLDTFINEQAPAARVKANGMGMDPRQLPDGTSLGQTDKQMLWDILTLDAIEGALWRRSEAGAAHAAEAKARVQALVARHQARFPGGEELPGVPGYEPRRRDILPWPAEPDAWTLRYAAAYFGQNGKRLSRKDSVAICVAQLRCSERAAGDAYTLLPEPLKVAQGRPAGTRVRKVAQGNPPKAQEAQVTQGSPPKAQVTQGSPLKPR
jgi:hypothetical protein